MSRPIAILQGSLTDQCRHFPRCGGCQILDQDYASQLRGKEEEVRRHFSAWPDLRIDPVLPSPATGGYRHKVQLPFSLEAPEGAGPGRPRAVALGCYEAGTHRVVDQRECLVQEPGLSRAAWAVRDWAVFHRVPVYREEDGSGWLRYLLLRRGAATGEVLLGLVTAGSGAPAPAQLDDLVARCRAALDGDGTEAGPGAGSRLVGIVQNLNPGRHNVVLGREERTLWGADSLREELGPFGFQVGVTTFFQVNPYQTPRLYDLAISGLPSSGDVLDLYCGIGTLTLWASRRASRVLGVEENPASVEAARRAAALNRVANADFLAGDVADVLSRLADEAERDPAGSRRFAAALVDPPRKGLEPSVRESLRRLAPRRLVYVSCYPATLARDAAALESSYRLLSVSPVDMFPHTRHIECVAVFEANSP